MSPAPVPTSSSVSGARAVARRNTARGRVRRSPRSRRRTRHCCARYPAARARRARDRSPDRRAVRSRGGAPARTRRKCSPQPAIIAALVDQRPSVFHRASRRALRRRRSCDRRRDAARRSRTRGARPRRRSARGPCVPREIAVPANRSAPVSAKQLRERLLIFCEHAHREMSRRRHSARDRRVVTDADEHERRARGSATRTRSPSFRNRGRSSSRTVTTVTPDGKAAECVTECAGVDRCHAARSEGEEAAGGEYAGRISSPGGRESARDVHDQIGDRAASRSPRARCDSASAETRRRARRFFARATSPRTRAGARGRTRRAPRP